MSDQARYRMIFNPMSGAMQLYPDTEWLRSVTEDHVALREVWDYGINTTSPVPGLSGWDVHIDRVEPNTIYRYSQQVGRLVVDKVEVAPYRSRVYLPFAGRNLLNEIRLPSSVRWFCDTQYIQYGFYLEFFYNFVKPVQYERVSGV